MTGSLHRRRSSVFDALHRHFGEKNIAAAGRAAVRLQTALDRHAAGRLPPVVLLAYGGGKDSSYMVAFVRLVQLLLHAEGKRAPRLRILTNRHVGMPVAVLENIDRAYRALELYDDPEVELLIVEGDVISEFRVDRPMPRQLVERNRLDVLMTGHRCHGEGRPTFCNACNLSMVSAFALGARHDGGVDLVITGDSADEQRAYLAWVNRMSRKLGADGPRPRDFTTFVEAVGTISDRYFLDIYGGPATLSEGAAGPSMGTPGFFSIYADTAYESGEHWSVLTGLLDFVFDDLAFSFTESDCANPALMAHLRGLRAEHVLGAAYQTGLAEYVAFATRMMRAKRFPEHLVATMLERYATPAGVAAMRETISSYARDAHGLDENQLICLVHSPLAGRGRYLDRYLRSEPGGLRPAHAPAIHALLDGTHAPVGDTAALAAELESVSGLELRWLRTLYHAEHAAPAPGQLIPPVTPIGQLLAGDPHKDVVVVPGRPGEAPTQTLITGR